MTRVFAYESEPYRTELEVRIREVGQDSSGPFAVVDDTILYPGGGGQPADRGTLNGVGVLGSATGSTGVRLDLAEPVQAGRGSLALDWGVRYDHMQQHTAQHLLSAVAADRFGWTTTSFHLGEARSDIELNTGTTGEEQLALLEARAMDLIRSAVPVAARRISRKDYAALGVRGRGLPEHVGDEVRVVEIEGVDLTTCGGTHLRSTAEIESICLLGTEPMRGGTRLHWVAGGRLRQRLRDHEDRTGRLRALLGVADDDLVSAVEQRVDHARVGRRRSRHLEDQLADEVARRLAHDRAAVVEAHFEDVEAGFLQSLARNLGSHLGERLALFTCSSDRGGFFLLTAGDRFAQDLESLGADVARLLDGRGGGSGRVFQGKAGTLTSREQVLDLLRRRIATTPSSE
jgi:Ser-tRNA(Ala) deacylase AlaX